jgi:hypothetical protein
MFLAVHRRDVCSCRLKEKEFVSGKRMEVAKAAGTLSRASATAGRLVIGHPVASTFHVNVVNAVGRMPRVIADDCPQSARTAIS